MPAQEGQYDEIEYGGLPVVCSAYPIMHCYSNIRAVCDVRTPGGDMDSADQSGQSLAAQLGQFCRAMPRTLQQRSTGAPASTRRSITG